MNDKAKSLFLVGACSSLLIAGAFALLSHLTTEVSQPTLSELSQVSPGDISNEWPDDYFGNLIPKPTEGNLNIIDMGAEGLFAAVSGLSEDYFESYVEKCVEAGFINSYQDGAYYGFWDEDGNELNLYKILPDAVDDSFRLSISLTPPIEFNPLETNNKLVSENGSFLYDYEVAIVFDEADRFVCLLPDEGVFMNDFDEKFVSDLFIDLTLSVIGNGFVPIGTEALDNCIYFTAMKEDTTCSVIFIANALSTGGSLIEVSIIN